MKLVVTQVQRCVNRLERLEVNVDLSFLAFRSQDFTTVDDKAIRRDLVVKLEPLLGRSDGGQDGLPVHTRLNVRCGTLGPRLAG